MAIYDSVVDKLIKMLDDDKRIADISCQFNEINGDSAKVHFADKILLESKLKIDQPMRESKNAEKSIELRAEGNRYFSLKNKDYFKALEYYNSSICHAPFDSEQLSIGYANRSAIYFEWKKYDTCLENIELAKKAGYPQRLMEKLLKRETECMRLLNENNNAKNASDDGETEKEELLLEPKLSYPPHASVPFIGECLELRDSNQYGRYVVTNRDLKVGQVVAVEDGFCSLLLPCVRYQRCANCLGEFDLSLIPCPLCTSAMYCSIDCQEEGDKNFHKYECEIIDFMFNMLNIIQLSAMRVVIRAITCYESVADLQYFVDNCDYRATNAFSLKYKDGMPLSDLYKAVHTLETNQDKRTTADLFQRAVITAILYRLLLQNTMLKDLLVSEQHTDLLIELIYRHLQTASTNFHRLETLANVRNANNLDDVSYGSGAYSFCSLINHSCAPNIVRLPIGQRIAILVLRPIKAGEQLLDNYG